MEQDAADAAQTEHSAMQQNATRMLEAGLHCIYAFQHLPGLPARLQQDIGDYLAALILKFAYPANAPYNLAFKVIGCVSL